MKLKIKLIVLAMISSLMLVACSGRNSDIFNEGQKALESHDYNLAMEKLSDVLEDDKGNNVARDMYTQAMRMKRVEEFEKNEDYEKALVELNAILELKNGSSEIKKEAKEKKKEFEQIIEKLQKEREERKENAKSTAENEKGKAESDALSANAHRPSHSKPSSGGGSDKPSGDASGGGSLPGGDVSGGGESSGGESSGGDASGQGSSEGE